MFRNYAQLILASGSPRRQEMLANLGIAFEIHVPNIDESEISGEPVREYVQRMAVGKALAVGAKYPDTWILSADTVVVYEDGVLGKPDGIDQAIQYLKTLNGQWHTVHTSFALCKVCDDVLIHQIDTTRVKMCNFEESMLAAYAATGEPLDKAGAYAVQGKGCFMIEALEGAWSTVVGLPLHKVVKLLLRQRIIIPANQSEASLH